jgi:Icc-related predicted phosphoesterase
MPEREITLCLFSDTHSLHRDLDMPLASAYLCGGDFTMFSKPTSSIVDFNAWLGELGAPVILIPGNHESFLEEDPSKRSLLSNATVLIGQSVDVLGLKVWGSPVTPLHGGAFAMSNSSDRRRLYASIPDDTDIFITHTPAYGILDSPPQSNYNAGCMELLEAVQRVQPILHVSGHIHGAYGTEEVDGTLYANAALLGPGGGIDHPPLLIRLQGS